jgi:hypothetical protein
MSKLWKTLCKDVLSYEHEEKDVEGTILDLIGNMASLRYAAEKVVSGAKPVGFTYWHFQNLFVNAINAANKIGFETELVKSSRQGELLPIIANLTTNGLTEDSIQQVVNYAAYCMVETDVKLATLCRRISNSLQYKHADDEDEE